MVVGMLLAGVCVALLVRGGGADGASSSTTVGMPPPTSVTVTAPPAGTVTVAPPTATPPSAGDAVSADPDEPWSPDVDPAAYARGLFVGTNEARADAGLPALTWSECAADQAVARAGALVGEPLEHAPLGPVLDTCASSLAAENLSRGAGTARRVVTLWLGSPGHRANLLAPDLDRLGVGCAHDGDDLVCAEVFLGHG
ncbi:MAG: hypothetical protein J7523_00850 [Cellulomonas sp.]|nr:hypothetical protein [Cellulomonas sp.]